MRELENGLSAVLEVGGKARNIHEASRTHYSQQFLQHQALSKPDAAHAKVEASFYSI